MSTVVIDIEANSLTKPSKIWLVVCKDIDTGKIDIFRNLHDDGFKDFQEYSNKVTNWIGHNCLEYDFPVLRDICGYVYSSVDTVTDTLILSRLIEYSRPTGHSVEAYGVEFGLPKIEFNDWTKWSQEMEDYCVRDVEINHRIYDRFARFINDPSWVPAIRLEHRFQLVVNNLHSNGFCFDSNRARKYLANVETDLQTLDKDILEQFPPRLKFVREVHPRRTKHGTLDRKDFRFVTDGDLSEYNGFPFSRCVWNEFNPSSHKQIISVLREAGWKPVDKTKTHTELEREISRLKYSRKPEKDLTLKDLEGKLMILKQTGWKINENNLQTLPPTAPSPARTLAKRILLESRRRTLVEWLSLVQDDGRIHGKFVGIGAWTHRMAHQSPNTANIPNATKEDGSIKLLGKELRGLWRAPKNRLLVGVDAEGIQFRIFAHYVNDRELIQAIVAGRKSDKTDPHSIHARLLHPTCKTRAAAKRFIYSLLLGGGVGKFAEILDCSRTDAQKALDTILDRYPGLSKLRREQIPSDAERGYFTGLDGRKVRIPGDTVGERKHLCMSGYLQNGEAIIMKMACLKWENSLAEHDAKLVNFVHDEWQVECPNNLSICLAVAKLMSDSLTTVGEELKLNCPMAGSYYNDDIKDYTIGTNWSVTH